eukprot:c23365_g1_i1.p1 GENE.c23365_g1_i1~~c23365_g1_i1.p1  ORF type:complete len:206 (-),score=41.21 c23365_g1_i1:42-629(-)
MTLSQREIKGVVVGNGAVGKTCLLMSFTKKVFPGPGEYIPTLLDNTFVNMIVDGSAVKVDLWDFAGQEFFDPYYPKQYPGTNVFLLCFSVVDPSSFECVSSKWAPELKQHVPAARLVLVGTKIDLRENDATVSKLKEKGMKPITPEQGRSLAAVIGATRFLECSALTQTGITTVFEEAVRAVLVAPQQHRCCLLL